MIYVYIIGVLLLVFGIMYLTIKTQNNKIKSLEKSVVKLSNENISLKKALTIHKDYIDSISQAQNDKNEIIKDREDLKNEYPKNDEGERPNEYYQAINDKLNSFLSK